MSYITITISFYYEGLLYILIFLYILVVENITKIFAMEKSSVSSGHLQVVF